MPHARLAPCLLILLALAALSLGDHQLAAPTRKLRAWPAANHLLLGPGPEARIGASAAALSGAVYMFGGATAMGDLTRAPVAALASAAAVGDLSHCHG